jgi:tRNA(fMet)-specific endonuclease VapC
MKFMLDTDTCIYLIKQKPLNVLNKFKTLKTTEVGISSITFAELEYGVFKSKYSDKNRKALLEFVFPLLIMPFDEMACVAYGRMRADLERKGKIIVGMDLLIGAHCLSLGATLVTNNEKEFSRIKGLKLENWAKD